jgi:outer membrane protein OmpA-like peptidoglycan-associated protein
MQAGVSISSNIGGNWTKPVALNIKNDYNFNEKANYFLTNNRQTLIMSAEREDSYGDRDLYVSFMQGSDSVWSEPLNLGDILNTAGTESAPFLASDDKTLYFSSNGFSGYGNSDIYVSKRLDDSWTNWTEPENLGPEINSPLEDLFFNIPASSAYAYYSRGVTETNTDIFRVKLPILRNPEPWVTVRGQVLDGDGNPVGAKIIYERLPDGKELGVAQTNPTTGDYEIRLPAGHLYGVRAEAKDKISEGQNLDLRNITSDMVMDHKDFELEPIKLATVTENLVVNLNNIFFDFDKETLKPESFPELNRVVNVMKEKPSAQVEIAGHTDAIGTEAYNLNLSERRAKSVMNYLIEKGQLEKSRVVVVFFGESKPVESNSTKEGRKKNRRVELKFLKL